MCVICQLIGGLFQLLIGGMRFVLRRSPEWTAALENRLRYPAACPIPAAQLRALQVPPSRSLR